MTLIPRLERRCICGGITFDHESPTRGLSFVAPTITMPLRASGSDFRITWSSLAPRLAGTGLGEEGYDEISGCTLVRVNAQLFRPAKALGLCGDASRAATILGWRPGSSFEDIVRMMAEADERRGSRDKQAVERSGTGGRHTGETFLKPPATAA
jgi:GDP-D-mannose dehydratase